MKYNFESQSVSHHFDGPKQIYQIHLNAPYQWLCNARSESEARRIVKAVKALLSLPQGAQIVNHLYNNVN